MKRIIATVCVLLLFGILTYFFSKENPLQEEVTITADATVTRTAQRYTPEEITISVGQTVLWKNESNEFHWPASDNHPTHRVYSEFDPKRPLGPTEEWTFTFTREGEWVYHDHLQANIKGRVIVIEYE